MMEGGREEGKHGKLKLVIKSDKEIGETMMTKGE